MQRPPDEGSILPAAPSCGSNCNIFLMGGNPSEAVPFNFVLQGSQLTITPTAPLNSGNGLLQIKGDNLTSGGTPMGVDQGATFNFSVP